MCTWREQKPVLTEKNAVYTHEGQLSTDKDDRKLGHILGHMLRIPFLVWARIKINSSPNRKWNYENVHKS